MNSHRCRSHSPLQRIAQASVAALALVMLFMAGCAGDDAPEERGAGGDGSSQTSGGQGGGPVDAGSGSGEPQVSEGSPEGGLSGWQDRCEGEGPIQLTYPPIDPAVVVAFTPLGSLAGGHVTPIDHAYLYPPLESAADAYPVVMMGDGYIKEVQRRIYNEGTPSQKEEYRLVFQHTCTFFSYVDLVRVLAPDIEAAFPELQSGNQANGHHFVPAGHEIGRIGGQSLDVAVYNEELPLTGFISPELYDGEPWKIYTDDFLAYLPADARAQILARSPRTVEPLGGKIDHDVPGHLMGNWFREGTNGYAGAGSHQYWDGHLAFVPDVYDPAQLKLSLGNYEGEAQQFSVRGNGPDFATVSAATGPVAYELLPQKVYNAPDDPIVASQNAADGPVLGVVLVEVIEGERLRVQVFPGQTADAVSGFTDEAQIYER
ncbi:MAG: hypothetical protein AB7F65_08765 [Dehalococcoidia bacterium]